MRAPEFWASKAEGRDRAPLLQALAAPVSWAYAATSAARIARTKPWKADIPVLCIGNVTIGGAGKTPVARAVRDIWGKGVATLSRGYGGALKGPVQVSPSMTARDVGDEPLLHAQDGQAWIARDRCAGASAIAASGAKGVIMDDGFQNPTLFKDVSFVVVDSEAGFGNERVFPAGPLREPIKAALARANAVIVLGEAGDDMAAQLQGRFAFRGPILHAAIKPSAPPPAGPLIAFAGIARPEKFFTTLRAAGGDIVEAIPFADHHPFKAKELAWLRTLAIERGARLITTQKDWVRLDPPARADIAYLPVLARFTDEAALAALLPKLRP